MSLSFNASMMRLKPSVSSRSASGAVVAGFFSCIAASAMGILPKVLLSGLSVQIVGKARHVVGEAERVVAHQFIGAIGGARFQSFDDVDVVADRTVGAILLAD